MKFVVALIALSLFAASLSSVDAGAGTVPGQIDRCIQEFTEGFANAALPRFFFNVTARACQRFTYRGGIILNIFKSRADCEKQCAKYLP